MLEAQERYGGRTRFGSGTTSAVDHSPIGKENVGFLFTSIG